MNGIKSFFDKFGTDTTTNFQLIKWGKELNIPNLKVIMRDEIEDSNGNYIICNLHEKKQKGIHWFCFTENIFFDSYGLPPPKEIIKKLKIPYVYSTFQIQNNEKFCGQLCLYVLYHLSKGFKFEDIILNLHEQIQNLK